MAEANGHDTTAADTLSAGELDALLEGLFEPTTLEIAPGRFVEIRPLMLKNADRLYLGSQGTAAMQRFLLARCVYSGGKMLGEDGADRLPVALAMKLAPRVMALNGMAVEQDTGGEGQASDPKA